MKNRRIDHADGAKTLSHKTRYIISEPNGYQVFTTVVANEIVAMPSHDGSVGTEYVMVTAIVTSLRSKSDSDPGVLLITGQKLRALDRPRILSTCTLRDRGARKIEDCLRSGFYKSQIGLAMSFAKTQLEVLNEEKLEYSLRHDII